jgi:hypothetical protein
LNEITPAILDDSAGRVAVIANLYGDGMYAMFCNLLYNPQLRHVVAVGQDLNLPTCREIESFLENGLEACEVNGMSMQRIPGTNRVFPDLAEFDVSRLQARLTFRYVGGFADSTMPNRLLQALAELPAPTDDAPDRIHVEIPTAASNTGFRRPSQIMSHEVTRDSPHAAWKELVVRTMRFGRPVLLGGRSRIELLNVKAVIVNPREDDPEVLRGSGFDLEEFHRYQQRILSDDVPADISYTYGNRLRGYFLQPSGGRDSLATAVKLLRQNPTTRHAFLTLWDMATDTKRESPPCLTTLFFRVGPKGLALTATYRAHNLLTAWLENLYGLIAIQGYVREQLEVQADSLTVVSHSLGIDPASPRYDQARSIERGWTRDDDFDEISKRYSLRQDPNGNFAIRADVKQGVIVAEHWAEGVLVKRYTAERADVIARQIAGDMAVSLPSHGLWIGQELVRKESELVQLDRAGQR